MPTPLSRIRRAVGLCAALSAALALSAVAPSAALGGPHTAGADRAKLQSVLDRMVKDGLVVSTSSVVEDDAGSWAGKAGVQDLASNTPAVADGYFRIGSNTKTMVATTVLSLVADGKVGLDDPVEKYLPGLLPQGDKITVRHLLSHTSGVYDHVQVMTDDGSLRGSKFVDETRLRTYSPQQLIDLSNGKGQKFEPGSKWEYSNTNYVVLGRLVEKVAGKPWRDLVKERVVAKAGLSTVQLPGISTALPAPHNNGYLTDQDVTKAEVTELNPSWGEAAGEGIAAGGELHDLLQALLGEKLIPKAQLDDMLKPSAAQGNQLNYGLGILRLDLQCGTKAYGHTGGIHGYVSVVFRSADNTRGMTLVMEVDKLFDTVTLLQLNELVKQYTNEFFCGNGNGSGGVPLPAKVLTL